MTMDTKTNILHHRKETSEQKRIINFIVNRCVNFQIRFIQNCGMVQSPLYIIMIKLLVVLLVDSRKIFLFQTTVIWIMRNNRMKVTIRYIFQEVLNGYKIVHLFNRVSLFLGIG